MTNEELNARRRFRYRTDPAYRAQQIGNSLRRYHDPKNHERLKAERAAYNRNRYRTDATVRDRQLKRAQTPEGRARARELYGKRQRAKGKTYKPQPHNWIDRKR